MPSVKEYQALQFQGFSKGLNTHADSSRLEAEELAAAQNFRLGPRGEMRLRSGYTRYDSNLTDGVDFIYPWRTATGVDHIVAVESNGTIWEDTLDGLFTSSGASINPGAPNLQRFGVGFASANKKVYVSSKYSDNVFAFDGTSWAAVPTIPKGKHLHHRHDRLFSINTVETPSRLFFSDFLAPEVFQVESWIDFDPEDGYEINASAVFGDDLILFKDQAIWKLSGREPASFATYRVDSERGCVSPRSVAQLRGRLIFFDRDTGVWAFDGAQFELLSDPINDDVLGTLDYDKSWNASAYVGDDRYYLSLSQADDSEKTYVYFADTGGWMEYNTGFGGTTDYLNERYQGAPGADGIYKADPDSQVYPPSGTPLVGKFRTPWVRVGGPGLKARIRRLEMIVKATDTVSFTVRMYRDFEGDTPYVTRTFQGGPVSYGASITDDERIIASDGWGNRLHAVQFEIETNDAPFQLNDMTVFYTGGVDVRGER